MRIITAREQAEMLSPWRREAADDGYMDLVHYTPDYNVQSIMDNGFRAGRGEGGYGAYFTPMGTDYKERSGEGRTPIHVRFKPQNTLQMGSGDDDEGYATYQRAAQENSERPDIPLTAQGYDSAHYKDPWGGSQFIVFDPSKVHTVGPLR